MCSDGQRAIAGKNELKSPVSQPMQVAGVKGIGNSASNGGGWKQRSVVGVAGAAVRLAGGWCHGSRHGLGP